MAGLSQNDWTHKFKVNGHNLTTWCALDTLYLPQILNQTAEVKSPDPLTGDIIQLTIGPDGIAEHSPAEAVLSIVVPKIKEKGVKSAEEIYMAFCNYSHYFTSLEAGQKWFADKHVEPFFLSIEEGHELGRKWFAQVLKHVESIRSLLNRARLAGRKTMDEGRTGHITGKAVIRRPSFVNWGNVWGDKLNYRTLSRLISTNLKPLMNDMPG